MAPRSDMRRGDTRSFIYVGKLAWWPAKGYPFRWKPEYGNPECVGELVAQNIWKNRIVLYIAVVVTLILIVQVFGISLLGDV
jgi:hypothetical protein